MSSITTIQSTDLITDSRADINTNFSNLNTDKIETSVLDTDTTLAANSDSKVATQKAVKAYVDANSVLTVSSEFTDGATHSLTTTANQRVVVFATGQLHTASSLNETLTIAYNAVTKQTIVSDTGNSWSSNIVPFSLTYTETPGAATANIVVASSAGSVSNVKIVVIKFNV